MRNVQFNKKVSVILIPSKEEYHTISSNLWYTDIELEEFKKCAINEINTYRSFHPGLNFKKAKDILYGQI